MMTSGENEIMEGEGGRGQGEGILENIYFSPLTSKIKLTKKWNNFF